MAQQLISVVAVALQGQGLDIIRNPKLMATYQPGALAENPWMLYYAKWFDPWLMGNAFTNPAETDIVLTEITPELYELTPNNEILGKLKNSLNYKMQFDEQSWYNWHLMQACTAYSNVVEERKIFVTREVLATSIDDNAVFSLLNKKSD